MGGKRREILFPGSQVNRSVTPSVFIVLPTDPTVAHAHDRILNSTHIFRGWSNERRGQATRLQLCTTFCENTGETVTTHFFGFLGLVAILMSQNVLRGICLQIESFSFFFPHCILSVYCVVLVPVLVLALLLLLLLWMQARTYPSRGRWWGKGIDGLFL